MSKKVTTRAARALYKVDKVINDTDGLLPLTKSTPNTCDSVLNNVNQSRRWLRKTERWAARLQDKVNKAHARDRAQLAKLNATIKAATKAVAA